MKVVESSKVKNDICYYAFQERGHVAVVTEGINYSDVLGITKQRYAVEFEIKVSKSDLDKELAAIEYACMTKKEGKGFGPIDDGPEQVQLNLQFAALKKKAGGWSKIEKHEGYVNPLLYFAEKKDWYKNPYIPNYFYMVVPNRLATYTIERLKGTGYGVIAYDGCRSADNHWQYKVGGRWYDGDRFDRPEGAEWCSGAPCGDACRKEVTVKSRARKLHSTKVEDDILIEMVKRSSWENITLLEKILEQEEEIQDLKKRLAIKSL